MMKRMLCVLCGGKGTRLGAITKKTPKPLIHINKKPFLASLIELYSPYFERILLLAGYKGEQFLFFGNERINVKIEQEALGTAGALLSIKNELTDYFYVCNGDTFLNPFDFKKFAKFCEKNKMSTLLLSKGERKAKGSVVVKNRNVFEFREKSASGKGYVYTGFCFIKKSALANLEKRYMSMEKEVLPMLAKKRKLLGYVCNSQIYDIGTAKGIGKFKSVFRL